MSTQDNINLVHQLFEKVYTDGDLEEMNNYFTDNVTLSDPATPQFKGGVEGLKKLETQYFHAFPNKKAKIQDVLAVENRVVVHWTCAATHNGTLAGHPATGNKIHISGISIYEFGSNGKIKKITQLWDRMALMEQIGEVQPLSVRS